MRLYALLDRETLDRKGWSIEAFVQKANNLGAKLLQYRDKKGEIETVQKALETIVSLFEGRVIINDHLVLATQCGGVHLGQEDLLRYASDPQEAIASIRRIVTSDRWIGLSTHNQEEIEIANHLPIDYIGLGACRATATKEDANVLGCEAVARLAALSRHPVAAIGGVRLNDCIEHVTWGVVGSDIYQV